MILHFNNTTIEVQPNDSSYRYRSLMAKPQLVLKFSLPRYVEIPVGAYCDYMGERYFLNAPQNIKKQGTRHIEYTLNMGTRQDNMALYKMRNSVDKRLKYSMCAKPHEFIAEIVANLNERDGAGVWSVGTCIDANEKTIEFNHTNIDSALSQVAETFETEWEIVGTTIHLHKVEYYKSDPLPLSYGKGNGFMPGVGRTTPSNELPIKRLYVQGGDRNIDRSEYGSPELLLPKSQPLGYDGTHFSDEQGYNANIGHIYTSDANGYYIERSDVISDAVKEDSLDCSEHYPSRIGKVTSVIAVKPAKNFYDFIDNTIPADLNINDYIIEGETPTIVFQSGMLAGEKEFEFKYKHSERRFEIVPQEIDGQTMPNATFIPAVNDTYAIFGIMLPPSYICDNAAKEGASWDMMREAIRHLWENENQKFTFTGTLQSLYAKRNWINIGGKLIVGGYVHFSDTQFVPDGVDIRITGIKDFLTSPYSPTVEISNNVTGQSLTSKLREIDSQEVIIEENHKDALQFTRRRFRDAQESLSMLEDAFDNFSGSVNPVTVQTMAMLVGDESLQFQFVQSKTSANIDTSFQVTYDAANKQLSVPHSFLRHMTLGIDSIKSSHSIDEYKTWEMTAYVSARLEDGSKKYYLYAKVDTAAAQNGEFLLSETPIDMERESGYYHLLVGVLNSELDEQRSYVSLYGFTEILPARITTDRIVSADGLNFIDLLNNALHLGDATNYLDWNNEEAATLIMSNATIKNALKVLGEALIAGFYFSNQIIKSSALTGQDAAMYLNGILGKIHLKSNNTGGDYSLDNIGSEIDIDASSGEIEVRNNNGVAYMSASGVFCNNAKTNAHPASSGYTHYGSIVGLGFGDIDNEWKWDKESTIIAGLYGRADNSGTALAYGAYIWDLFAAGIILRQKYVGDSYTDSPYQIGSGVTQIVGLSNSGKTAQAILPSDGMEGKVIYVKQIGAGKIRVSPKSGQKIYDDNSENAYYECSCGQEMKFTFAKYRIDSVTTEVWLVSRWKF